MNVKVHDTGYMLLAKALAGMPCKIDRMLVELDTVDEANVPAVFDVDRPCAKVAVRCAVDGACAVFSALVRPDDFDVWKPGSKVTRVTLVSGQVPVATSLVLPPVELLDNAYTNISAEIKFGD